MSGTFKLDRTGSRCRNMKTGKYAKATLCKVKKERQMKLSIGQCACAKNRRVYCRTKDGYRFTGKRCTTPGKKVRAQPFIVSNLFSYNG